MTHPRILTATLLLACTPAGSSPERGDASQVPAPAEPTPAPAAAGTPEAPADDPAPAAAPTPPASPFHTVASLDPAIDDGDADGVPHWRVYGVGDDVFVSAGPQVMHVARDGTLTRDPKWLRGLESVREPMAGGFLGVALWDTVTVGGRWPGALYTVLTIETGSRGEIHPNSVYRRVNEEWIAVDNKRGSLYRYPVSLQPWVDGSVLALRRFTPAYEYEYHEDETYETPKRTVERARRAIAKQKSVVVIRGAAKAPDLGKQAVAAFAAHEDGAIVAVTTHDPPKAVHYDHATKATRMLPVPGAEISEAQVELVDADDVWIYGRVHRDDATRPYLAHFDGAAWEEAPTPACTDTGLGSFSVAPGAGQWAVCGHPPEHNAWNPEGELWHRPDGKAWAKVTLPDDGYATQVLARGPDDVWVAGKALYHTRPRETVLIMPGLSDLWLELLEMQPPVEPFTCDFTTMLIEGEPEGDHEALVARLGKGLTAWKRGNGAIALVEVEFRGEARLALQTMSIDRDDRKLSAIVRKVVGDALGPTYCAFRESTRELGMWTSQDGT